MPGPSSTPASDQLQFIQAVAARTGIDPRVIKAWVQQEGADAPGGTGHSNYLNLRPYPGDPYSSVSSGNFEQFSTVQDAIDATVRRLNQQFAAPIIQAARTPGATPYSEIAAIASTGWDAGHYGGPGGPNLQSTFRSIYGSSAGAGKASSTADTSGQSSIGSNFVEGAKNSLSVGLPGGQIIPDILGIGSAWNSLSTTEKIFAFLTSWRFAEVLGGFFLLLVGIYLLGRQFGVSPPVGSVAVAAATKNPAALGGALGSGVRSSQTRARAQRSEGRAQEMHTAKVKTQQARATELRTRTRHRAAMAKGTKASREAEVRSAYIRGAADAEGFPRSA